MKLRIRGNSVRLRLTRGEVEQFGKTGLVEDTVEFGFEPHQRFVYALSAADADNPTAVFENNRMTVSVPKRIAEEWVRTNQVGIRAEQTIAAGRTLGILVEKDFACLEERAGEDESDAFPHPLSGELC